MSIDTKIAIIGGGIAGLALALNLQAPRHRLPRLRDARPS